MLLDSKLLGAIVAPAVGNGAFIGSDGQGYFIHGEKPTLITMDQLRKATTGYLSPEHVTLLGYMSYFATGEEYITEENMAIINNNVSWLIGEDIKYVGVFLYYDENETLNLVMCSGMKETAEGAKYIGISTTQYTTDDGDFFLIPFDYKQRWTNYRSAPIAGFNGELYLEVDPFLAADEYEVQFIVSSRCDLYRFDTGSAIVTEDLPIDEMYTLWKDFSISTLNVWHGDIIDFHELRPNLLMQGHTENDYTIPKGEGYQGGYSQPANDEGDWDFTSGKVHPEYPESSIIDTGFCTVYDVAKNDLRSFNQWLWTIPTTVWDFYLKAINNPLDLILNLHMIPCTPTTTAATTIKFLGQPSNTTAPLVTDQFCTVECGVVSLRNKLGSFADYAPHTQIKIYLPFCGCFDLDPVEAMASDIHVFYRVDVVSGDCTAFVEMIRNKYGVDMNDTLYSFNGNCSIKIPITGANYSNILSGGIGLIGDAIGGNVASMVGDLVTGAKVNVSHAGAVGGTAGYMGVKKPYLIMQSPIYQTPPNQDAYRGRPVEDRYTLSNLKGYVEVDKGCIWTLKFKCTQPEADEIKQLLTSGVVI